MIAGAGIKARAHALLFALASVGIPRVPPRIVRVLPHDPEAYTQGLACHGGVLYESTGGEGRSSLRRLDPVDGHAGACVPVADDFAEDIAVHRDVLYQLAWISGRVRRYRLPAFEPLPELAKAGEGWGLAAAPEGLWASDGSHRLVLHDPADFAVRRRLSVRSNGLPLRHLNALAWAEGRLYANLWYRRELAELCPRSGRLLRLIDCAALLAHERNPDPHAILNGIAHDPASGHFFLTGKHWRHLYEVALPQG